MNSKYFIILAGVLLLGSSDLVMAASSTGEGYLPYESWLIKLRTSLTGPVAFSVSVIGIVSCGATLIFTGGEISRFMRSLLYMVMVFTFLIGANSLITNFFEGAVIAGENVEEQELVDYIEEAYRHFGDRVADPGAGELFMYNELVQATV